MSAPEALRRAALYARVSTPDQAAGPQLARLREWAEREGYAAHLEREDVASGRLVRRPGAEAVMQAARGHHVHAVAVAKVDRWARSVQHLAATVEELHGLGVAFYAVDQGLAVRPGDPTSRLILNVLGAVAEWEASIISERTKDALRALPAGKGAGRHRRGCGEAFPCPTGAHRPQGKGIAETPRGRGPGEGGSETDVFSAGGEGR